MSDKAHRLSLRALRAGDEDAFAAAHRALVAEGTSTGSAYKAGMDWAGFLTSTSDLALGRNLPPGWVTTTFLVGDVDGTMVGTLSLRHTLTPALRQYGGHIGYTVLAEHRRHGYATELLRQGLVMAGSIGIESVLVTCDDDNVGSIKVIEANGGRLEGTVHVPGHRVETRHYWID